MERSPIRWWQWPTVLSLDAPLVALAWQEAFAQAAGARLGPAPRFVLGASVWLSYAGDRWFEGWRLSPEAIRTQRHFVYQRWRWPVCALGWAVIGADLYTAYHFLSPRDLQAGYCLLGPVLAYLFSRPLLGHRRGWQPPKEAWIALLFGAGSSLFVLSAAPRSLARIALPLGLFMVLCFANCALISVWEEEVDRQHGQVSFHRQFPAAERLCRALPWALAAAAALALPLTAGGARAAAACAGASGLLLGAVDRLEPRLGRRGARVLADLVLLTPWLAFLF
ncbi:MAG TPA: hypothetical protein VHV47_03030 [Opitutaceae bacterium]|nr:hypothetical protein [Opitutaceae bacterium]